MPLIDPLLAAILVCPADQGDLTADEARSRLVCGKCTRAYPVTEGIPVMLIEEAALIDEAEVSGDESQGSDGD